MHRRSLLPLLPMLSGLTTSGCVITIGNDDDEAGTTDGESSSSPESSTTQDEVGSESSTSETSSTDGGSTDAGTTTDTDTATGSTDSTGTTDSTDSTESGTSDSGTTTETGGGFEEPPPGYCGMAAGPDTPWATFNQFDQILEPSDPFELQCGGQGSWMFRFDFTLGGFQPAGKVVPIDAWMDVEGFDIGPNGHFAQVFQGAQWFLGCCPEDYYEFPQYCTYDQYLTFYPPDAIADLAVLDGLPATIHLVVDTPEGILDEQLDVTIWAVYEQSWELCLYEYYAPLPPPILDVPIPGAS